MYALSIQQIKITHLSGFITPFSAKMRLSKTKKKSEQLTKPFFKDNCFVASFDLVSLSFFRFFFFRILSSYLPSFNSIHCCFKRIEFYKRLDLNDIPYLVLSALHRDGASPRPSSLPETAMDRTTVFPPNDWSVYKKAIRINNDIEGCHKYNALNRRGGGQSALLFYLLI